MDARIFPYSQVSVIYHNNNFKNKKINESKSWEIIKIDKSLARFIQKQGARTHINKIRNQKGLGTTYTIEKQRIIDTTTNNYMPIRWTT